MLIIDVFTSCLAIIDPITWLVAAGCTKLVATAIVAAGAVAVVAVAYLSFASVMNHIKTARQRQKATRVSKIVKSRVGKKTEIGIIDLNSSGDMTGAKIYEADSIDTELAQMANITIVRHNS